ncbi:MAG: hypothetical protein JWM88_1245 [Verrucomicrobia bacterium]|nr:hypothetical protein [Verrucomicrobiota bacterium]
MGAMSSSVAEAPVSAASRRLQITPESKQKPLIVDLLNDWQYLEKATHRLICAWGREVAPWFDKSAIHRHVWDQAECVRRLRERVAQFPGGKPDAPVSGRLEKLANTVLLAPTFQDGLDGIYEILLKALLTAYGEYSSHAHPVHDAPTVALLHEINQIKSQEFLWYRDFRRRFPHAGHAGYRATVERAIADCGGFHAALPLAPGEPGARPAGAGTDFKLARFSARNVPIRPRHEYMDYVRVDFPTSIEARRLFWGVGYMMEKNLPDDQLCWIYDGHYLPWEWHHDISRHLWDESRHGDSGYSRLRDFGIDFDDVGFPGYDQAERIKVLEAAAKQEGITLDEAFRNYPKYLDPLRAEHITRAQMYEHVFMIGMVAETGHFIVKQEAYGDFKEGQDLESAEMMLFDIIDETAHVQYAHKWLPLLGEVCGVDNSTYRERGATIRAEYQKKNDDLSAELAKKLPRIPGNPQFDFYQDLLARIRRVKPLANAVTCGPRSPKPM